MYSVSTLSLSSFLPGIWPKMLKACCCTLYQQRILQHRHGAFTSSSSEQNSALEAPVNIQGSISRKNAQEMTHIQRQRSLFQILPCSCAAVSVMINGPWMHNLYDCVGLGQYLSWFSLLSLFRVNRKSVSVTLGIMPLSRLKTCGYMTCVARRRSPPK